MRKIYVKDKTIKFQNPKDKEKIPRKEQMTYEESRIRMASDFSAAIL